MSDPRLDIVNRALSAVGEDPLATLTPGMVMSNAALLHYDSIVAEELENGDWKFASKTETSPSLLTALAGNPLKYQWQIPSDSEEIQAVLHCGRPLDGEFYQIEGEVIRCAFNSNITIKYSFRPSEDVWPQRFQRIIVQRLEAIFLRVVERYSEAQERDEDTAVRTQIAKHTEARQQRNRPLGPGTIAQARLRRGRRGC